MCAAGIEARPLRQALQAPPVAALLCAHMGSQGCSISTICSCWPEDQWNPCMHPSSVCILMVV